MKVSWHLNSRERANLDMNESSTILIADDDLFYRQILSEQVRELGYKPFVVRDGAAALRMLRQRPGEFICLVFDVFMPKLTGLNLLELVAQEKREHEAQRPPIIIVTSDETPETERAARMGGASFFLLKPFTRADMKRALLAALSGAHPA